MYKIQPVNNEEEFVTCKMTTLASQTKLICQMMIRTDQNKLENFACFLCNSKFFDSKTLSNTSSQN